MADTKCQVVFHPGNCLNKKKPFARQCRQCIESCPHGAIREDREPDAERCTNCGACMAVCPSDGLVHRIMDTLHEYLFEADAVVLHCRSARPDGFDVACLGALDRDLWTTLILLAAAKPVKVMIGECNGCDDRQACQSSLQTLRELQKDWPGHPEIVIETGQAAVESGGKTWVKTVSRRDFITGWRQLFREKVNESLPGLAAGETYSVPRSREWMAKALQAQPERQIPFLALDVQDSCTSCGVCSAVCPQGALHKQDESGKISLVLEPFKCVQCRRCLEICPPKALSIAPKVISLSFLLGKVVLHAGSPSYCSRCGKQIFDTSETSLCAACATDDHAADFLF